MKQQSFTKSPHLQSQEPPVDNEKHKRSASRNQQRPVCAPVHKKPLSGRIFYLDLPCNKRSQCLESDIKSLGGTVEKFFSKEIGYLVSGKPEARHVQRLVQDSPVPSPDSGLSSPHPGSRRDNYRGSSLGGADTVTVSRGKSLVEKVVKEQKPIQMNRILTNALEWGVKILYVDDITSYIDKKRSLITKVRTTTCSEKKANKPESGLTFQKCRAGRISRPFVKVEDSSRHYRPIYLPMACMPVCNLTSAAPCSPFMVEEAAANAEKKLRVGGDRGERTMRDRRKGHEGRARRKGGYCECCGVKYDNLQAHLQGQQHQAFSKSEEYLVVDSVIAGLTCDFLQISPKIKRTKCSSSTPSPVVSPACGVKKCEDEALHTDHMVTDSFCGSQVERSVRKRSRELSQGAREGPSDSLPKSQSKRGSFEWECSSNASFTKPAALLQPITEPGCLSDRKSVRSSPHSELRTSHRVQHKAPELRTTRESGAASEPTAASDHRTHESLHNPHPELCSELKRLQERERTCAASPSGAPRRKVRNYRRRRSTPGRRAESTTQNVSASLLYLRQLFQSSDSSDEEFKGFYE